jgi:predicted RNase H-like nuclease
VPGRLAARAGPAAGVTAFPFEPEVFPTFAEILDYRPAYDVIAIHCHLSFPEEDTQGGRTCDKLARQLLGWPRAGAIGSPPSRHYLRTGDLDARAQKGLNPINARMMRRYAEVAEEMQPYRQRQVFEVHPELSFYQLNDDKPMQHSKYTDEGVAERRALVEQRIQGIDVTLDGAAALPAGVTARHLLDAAADMTTARRIAARAVERLPEDPEWDEAGVRMELCVSEAEATPRPSCSCTTAACSER